MKSQETREVQPVAGLVALCFHFEVKFKELLSTVLKR